MIEELMTPEDMELLLQCLEEIVESDPVIQFLYDRKQVSSDERARHG